LKDAFSVHELTVEMYKKNSEMVLSFLQSSIFSIQTF